MAALRILTVEDDAAIRRGIVDALSFAGYDVIEAANGKDGCAAAVSREYDLLLLDMVLPGKTGLEILREVRNARPTLPVIILSAQGEERDRVTGLKLGADDYVVKPFSVNELLARVEAVLRRSPARPTDVEELQIAGGRVDFARCEVRFEDGGREELSERELELLRYFAAMRGGRLVARNCWRMCGRSMHVGLRHGRSICMWRGCGRSCAIPMGNQVCFLPFAVRDIC
jgi:DNA-binding response OmpR family regulator